MVRCHRASKRPRVRLLDVSWRVARSIGRAIVGELVGGLVGWWVACASLDSLRSLGMTAARGSPAVIPSAVEGSAPGRFVAYAVQTHKLANSQTHQPTNPPT